VSSDALTLVTEIVMTSALTTPDPFVDDVIQADYPVRVTARSPQKVKSSLP